jgi:hypothetical protein
MFCCRGFEALTEQAGQKGISVLIFESGGRFLFELQSRAMSKEDEAIFTQDLTRLPGKGTMTLVANVRLSYCPYCGTKLQSLVKRSTRKAFEAFAEKHVGLHRRPFS